MAVQILDKSFLILETLSREFSGITLSELSVKVNLNITTVHRILSTFADRGYIQQDVNKLYSLSLKFLELSGSYLNSLDLKTVAENSLQELSVTLEETVFLATSMDNQVVYIDRFKIRGNSQRYAMIGERQPMYCTSLGKSLLMGFSKKKLIHYAENCDFEKLTENTLQNKEQLLKEIEISKARGWSMDNEEMFNGVICFSAPIHDYRGVVIAAISISVTKETLKTLSRDQICSSLITVSEQISHRMGYKKKE